MPIRHRLISVALVLLVTVLVLGLNASRTTSGTTASAAKFSVTLTFKFGKRQPDEKCGPGKGICELKLGLSATSGSIGGVVSPLNDQKLECVFQSRMPDGSSTFTVDRDIQVDPTIAQKLGFKTLVLRRGEYSINAAKGSFGGVELNASTTK